MTLRMRASNAGAKDRLPKTMPDIDEGTVNEADSTVSHVFRTRPGALISRVGLDVPGRSIP
jgi:hypothetical protein